MCRDWSMSEVKNRVNSAVRYIQAKANGLNEGKTKKSVKLIFPGAVKQVLLSKHSFICRH